MTPSTITRRFGISLVLAFFTYISASQSVAQSEGGEVGEGSVQATRDLKEDTFDSRSAPADVRNAIDQALRESGDLGVYGDLSRGLAELEKEFQVTIHQSANAWHLSLGPISGAGHDFSLTIIAATGEVVDVVIGEVVPPRRVPDGR